MIVLGITILQFSGIQQQPTNDQRSCLRECTERPQLYSETLCCRWARNAPSSLPPKRFAAGGRATPPNSLPPKRSIIGAHATPLALSFRNVLSPMHLQCPHLSRFETLCCRCAHTQGRAGHSTRGHRLERQPQRAQQEGRTDGWRPGLGLGYPKPYCCKIMNNTLINKFDKQLQTLLFSAQK